MSALMHITDNADRFMIFLLPLGSAGYSVRAALISTPKAGGGAIFPRAAGRYNVKL